MFEIGSASQPGSVIVWGITGGEPVSSFGALYAHAFAHGGARAVVVNGNFRDVDQVVSRLPVWARGTIPASGQGCFDYECNVPVRMEGVDVRPGDIVACDRTGVVVLPGEVDLDELSRKMAELRQREARFVDALSSGKDLAAAVQELTHI